MSGSLSPLSVDTSIPLQAGKIPERPNPFQSVNQFAETWRGVNAAKGSEVDLATKTNQAVYAGLAPLLAEKNLTLGALTTRSAILEKQFGLPSGTALKMVSGFSAQPDTPEWDRQLRNAIASGMQTDPGAAYGLAAGQQYNQDVGNAIISGVQQPAHMGGARTQSSSQPKYVTPQDESEIVTTEILPDGRVVTGPKRSRIPTDLMVPGGSRETTGKPAFTTDGGYRPPEERKAGGLPPALRGPNQPPAAGTPAPGATPAAAPGTDQKPLPPGSVVTVAPGTVEAQTADAQEAVKRWNKISDEGSEARTQQTLLANMHNDLMRFDPGSGAQGVNEAKRAIATWGQALVGSTFNVDMSKLNAYEAFQKTASQIANAQGAGSNEKMHVQIHSNPNVAMSKGGNDYVIRQLFGNADYLRARQQAAAQWQGDPRNKKEVTGWLAAFENKFDPRTFQFMRMDDNQRKEYLASIKIPGEKERFQQAWRNARDAGFFGN